MSKCKIQAPYQTFITLSSPQTTCQWLGDFVRALSRSFSLYFRSAQGEGNGVSPALGTRDTPCMYYSALLSQLSRVIDNARAIVI